MRNIKEYKPTKGKLIVQLIGTEELYAAGIIIPQKKLSQAKEAVIISVPDDNIYVDQNIDDMPERKFLVEPGDVVLLNHNLADVSFEALNEDNETKTYQTIKPDAITGIYKKGTFRDDIQQCQKTQ